jgi:hypothetical protein
MAIYNNETDPNVTDWNKWQQEQIEMQINEPRKRYQEWWEQNKERILAEDQLNHDMQFKSAYIKQGNY